MSSGAPISKEEEQVKLFQMKKLIKSLEAARGYVSISNKFLLLT